MITLKIIPTHLCNHQCKYCDEPKNLDYQFAAKAFYQISDYLERIPNLYVQLEVEGGGEPLCCPDLFDYLNYRKHSTMLFTNGTLLTQEIIDRCHENISFRVSLDGTKEVHDKYRKMKSDESSYEATIQGINLLNKNKRQYMIGSVVDIMTAPKLQESYAVIDFLKPYRWSITPKMVPEDRSITQAIVNYTAPIVAALEGETPVDFYDIANGDDPPGGNLEILVKNKIQLHSTGYDTKNLREYSVEELDLFLKELKDYV